MTPVLQEPVSITPALARRIEIWPVGRLVPYARNARTHSDAQVAQIAASIAEFGFNAPILVDSNAGIVAQYRPADKTGTLIDPTGGGEPVLGGSCDVRIARTIHLAAHKALPTQQKQLAL